ncbi:MAG: hypothetical protein COW00_07940 [Bdellovibrio sp. CG12_big_fil_rev_8_21_14_0_65_39_13]|nr:MAG: hypothetical protein COW78_11905 [Bdellovibrio sp. CG22_combo_CG10-13_8_21_14_all_39_27]PIQ59974.1 MAG: hypothetical protein COW00_07940 [Bdellovibrio sp. CG12_big_fil_rev_8_21_14_0_65_39_13]PIR35232.1 MAG: hypothetical protein COV37_09045 [Bdellovibrio sp. CG11_big_fil_rev_8_21_14_0_20_39_38]
MRILIVDDDDSIRDYLIIVLENLLDSLDIIECTSSQEALKLVSADPYFQLIISDYDMPGGNGDQLYLGLKERNYEIPFLLHSSRSLEEIPTLTKIKSMSKDFFYIQKGLALNQFESALQSLAPFKGQAPLLNYKRVRIYFFLRFSKSLCDVYIKLNDQKYIKFIHKDDAFDSSQIKRILEKNVEYLYITDQDYLEFAVSLVKQPFLLQTQDMTPEDRIKSSQMMLQHMAMTTGLTRSVLSMAERNIELVMMEAADLDQLSKLLNQLRARQDYNYDHAYLLCYFCCVLCDALGWQTRRSREKLCFASLFHDITLKDPDLSFIQRIDDQRLVQFSPDEIQEYKSHPQQSASLLGELAESYPQVDQIVEQHHERPDGSGFPKGLKAHQLQPMSCLFIVCHALVSEMYKLDFDKTLYPKMMKDLKLQYNLGHFQKIVEKLEDVLLKVSSVKTN